MRRRSAMPASVESFACNSRKCTFFQSGSLCAESDFGVAIGRFQACVAQPGANDIYLDAGFQEVDRGAVSPDVGRYRFELAIRSLFDYLRCVAADDFVDSEPG